jgi:hypothetical protein
MGFVMSIFSSEFWCKGKRKTRNPKAQHDGVSDDWELKQIKLVDEIAMFVLPISFSFQAEKILNDASSEQALIIVLSVSGIRLATFVWLRYLDNKLLSTTKTRAKTPVTEIGIGPNSAGYDNAVAPVE